MNLRTPGDHRVGRHPRLRGLRLLGPCAVLAVLLLALFAGSSGAGVSQYSGTLYLAGPGSSIGSGNYQITTAVPAAQGVAPTTVAGAANSGGVPTGSYKYVYVTTSGGASTASVASNPAVSVTNAPVTVSNVPVGADVYRAKIAAGNNVGTYILVGNNAGPTTTYTDTSTATTGALLPQADNRVALSMAGWAPFTPGTSLATSLANTAVSASTPSIPSSCTGWIVDAPGDVSFTAGTWTFYAQARTDANGNGAAVLSAAMWKVDGSGTTVAGGTVVPPTDGSSFTFNNMSQSLSVSYTTSSATMLASNEHLCVQFWRHQTTGYTSGGATSRTSQLLAWDPNNKISVHPAPNGFASAALSSPADGLATQTVPTLGATYSDPEADAGTLNIRLCSDSGCGGVLQSSGALAATNGSTQTWTPSGSLAEGTYYWQAQAQDGLGLASAWTSSRSFVVDTTAPTTVITANPPATDNSAGGSFSFNANEAVTGYQCKVDGGAFAACSSPFSYSGLSDGGHTFQVKATADLAGNAGSPNAYGWTIDTTPPDTSLGSHPAVLSTSAGPSFSFSATEVGSSFECSLDGGAFAACPSPQVYASVADGPHTFQVRAVDAAGNPDPTPASYSWTIDATAPDTAIGPSQPAVLTTATGATFDLSSTEPGSTFECRRDGAAFAPCTTPKTYSGLADGSHTFDVRATDVAGNTDASPASYTWVVDTTPPNTSIGPTTPPASSNSTSASFDVASTEPGSSFQCSLDGAAYAACSSPVAYGGLGNGAHTFSVRATDPAGNADTSAAVYTWQVDTVAPSTPSLISPADAALVNAAPELDAVFGDATPGDSGTVEFRVCSTAAPAGSACAPLVASASAAPVGAGSTASATPAPLASGTYYWQARVQDVAGNVSGWSSTRSFQLDSSTPSVPVVSGPADGAWINAATLQGTFSKASFAATGTIEFRVCTDGACLAIESTGFSGQLVNGATASWALPERLSEGMYWWQARATDAYGNSSGWSSVRMFHLDKTAPAAPTGFGGTVAGDGLTLRWNRSSDGIANYVVYVDGISTASLGGTTYEYKAGTFDSGDTRSFNVVAVDLAGNRSTMSTTLVGVPDMVGLTVGQAASVAAARGLSVRREATVQRASGAGVVTSQNPPAGSVAAKGTAVSLVFSSPSGPTPLAVSASPTRLVCSAGSVVRVHVRLSLPANLRARLYSGRRSVLSKQLGHHKAGSSDIKIKLPGRLARGSYKLRIDATAGSRHATTQITLQAGGRRACSSR
jgi:hypothetical protein